MKCSEQHFKPRQMLPGNLQPRLKAIGAFQDFYLSLLGVNDVPCPCGSQQMCKALPRKAMLSSQESGKSGLRTAQSQAGIKPPSSDTVLPLHPSLKELDQHQRLPAMYKVEVELEGTLKPISPGQGRLPADQAAPRLSHTAHIPQTRPGEILLPKNWCGQQGSGH